MYLQVTPIHGILICSLAKTTRPDLIAPIALWATSETLRAELPQTATLVRVLWPITSKL